MNRKFLGKTIDIHCGGEDLQFPHHENEIAQSEAANDAPFAHYWMHNGFLNIDNKKMSKSLGNFFLTREVAAQYGYEVIRYLMIQAQYRAPMNYSTDLLDACKASLDRLYQCRDTVTAAIKNAKSGAVSDDAKAAFDKARADFIASLEDDLNTADALTAIFELVRVLNVMAADANTAKEQLEAGLSTFNELVDVLGLLYERKEEAIPQEVLDLVEQRAAARKAKDFAEADRLRDAITALGWSVRETRQGVEIKKL
jgi:cysteinyl-tRNA synthetase